MRRRTLITGKGTCARIGNMTLVIRAVHILPVPAGRKDDGCSNTARAGLGGKCLGVFGVARRAGASRGAFASSKTAMADTGGHAGFGAKIGISCEHAEALEFVSKG